MVGEIIVSKHGFQKRGKLGSRVYKSGQARKHSRFCTKLEAFSFMRTKVCRLSYQRVDSTVPNKRPGA